MRESMWGIFVVAVGVGLILLIYFLFELEFINKFQEKYGMKYKKETIEKKNDHEQVFRKTCQLIIPLI